MWVLLPAVESPDSSQTAEPAGTQQCTDQARLHCVPHLGTHRVTQQLYGLTNNNKGELYSAPSSTLNAGTQCFTITAETNRHSDMHK